MLHSRLCESSRPNFVHHCDSGESEELAIDEEESGVELCWFDLNSCTHLAFGNCSANSISKSSSGVRVSAEAAFAYACRKSFMPC
jgi:hypothetical protein